MELAAGLVGGFILGILASSIAWLITERLSAPRLHIRPDQNRYPAPLQGTAGYELYHIVVTNAPTRWPFPARQPAWACTARIEVLRHDGTASGTPPVHARWTTQPEPLLPMLSAGQPHNVLDPARVMQSRRMDVHAHHTELIPVAIKFEGEPDCHLFSNESYAHSRWQNPAWRLGTGAHRLRAVVLHQGGESATDLELRNDGRTRDSVRLLPWNAN